MDRFQDSLCYLCEGATRWRADRIPHGRAGRRDSNEQQLRYVVSTSPGESAPIIRYESSCLLATYTFKWRETGDQDTGHLSLSIKSPLIWTPCSPSNHLIPSNHWIPTHRPPGIRTGLGRMASGNLEQGTAGSRRKETVFTWMYDRQEKTTKQMCPHLFLSSQLAERESWNISRRLRSVLGTQVSTIVKQFIHLQLGNNCPDDKETMPLCCVAGDGGRAGIFGPSV